MKKFERIKRLNDLLKHHQGYTLLDLMALLDAGERTVRKDLCQIQQPPYHAELWDEYRGKERLYRYKDISYSLPLFDDNDHVRDKLHDAMESIDSYKGTPQYEWLRMCLVAIENDSLMGVSGIMSFDNNAYLVGIEYIGSLTDAIANKYPVKLRYQPYGAEERGIQVNPYHLKQYNNRWFLIAKPMGKDVLYNYALDRIKGVEHLAKPYEDTDVDFSEYFDDVVGVSVTENPVEHIVLMVSRKRYPYLDTKPLHWSQKHWQERDAEEWVCLSLDVKPNKELLSLLLSFGADVVVVSPLSLRTAMAENIKKLYLVYGQDGKT